MKVISRNTFAIFYCITFTVIQNFPVDSKSVRVHTGTHKRHRVSSLESDTFRKRNKVSTTRPTTAPETPKISKTYVTKDSVKIKKQDDNVANLQSINSDPIQLTFDTGIRRLFQFLNERFSFGLPEDENSIDNFKTPVFFPSNYIFSRSFNFTNIIKLLNAPPESDFEKLAETAVVDGVSQLVRIIGFDDLRDWLGIILASFIMGPVLIPLLGIPFVCFSLIGLLFPLFLFNPPSKPNTNVIGHDPIVIEPRQARSLLNSLQFHEQNINLTLAKANRNANSTDEPSSSSFLDGCVERVACQFARIYRDNPVSQWLARRFNSTKVEWARFFQADSTDTSHDQNNFPAKSLIYLREDCKKYICPLFPFTA